MRLIHGLIGVAAALLIGPTTAARAGVVSYQGRVELGGSPYTGPGTFKFAVVNPGGTATYWSNDGTSVAGSQPAAGVTLVATNGLFDVLLGDATITNMTDLPGTAFPSGQPRMLRVWFSATNAPGSFTQLAPDRRVASAPSALQAEFAASARVVIPFSAGNIVPASISLFSPIVVGFGASKAVTSLFPSPVQIGQLAFTAPSNGVLERLQVSADVHFVPNTAQGPINYTFTILTSPGSSGVLSPYSPTPLSAVVSFAQVPPTTYPTGAYVTASGFVSASIPVLAGDRIVLQVVTDIPFAPPALDELGIHAGLLFTPGS